VEAFDDFLKEKKIIFEFVALITGNIRKGTYRHFYNKHERGKGKVKPALYEEIPPELISNSLDYDDWQMCEIEVLATAQLPNDCSAIRIRSRSCGWQERIRAQLAMMGCPVLNDQDVMVRGTQMPAEVARNAGLIGDTTDGKTNSTVVSRRAWSTKPLGGAVGDDVARQPYAKNLQLLPGAKSAAERGVPQTGGKKVPVGLHLARIEFLGRVVTCAPPKYWPEGAAAAVAIKLTEEDLMTGIKSFLFTQGGFCRFGKVGGKFGVKVDFLEKQFWVNREAGVVFVSAQAKHDWEGRRRVKIAEKQWREATDTTDNVATERQKQRKLRKMRQKEMYVPFKDFNKKGGPRYDEIKKQKFKPVSN